MCYFQVKDYRAIKRTYTYIQLDLKNILLSEKSKLQKAMLLCRKDLTLQAETALFLERLAYKVGPQLVSGKLDFGNIPTVL